MNGPQVKFPLRKLNELNEYELANVFYQEIGYSRNVLRNRM